MAAEKDDGTGSKLRSLIYSSGDDDDDAGSHHGGRPTLKVLDQLLLPAQKKYIDVVNVKTTWSVIRDMNVRGAPLIAIVACLGLAVDLCGDAAAQEMSALGNNAEQLRRYVQEKLDYLATSRPTAVNLFHALEEIRRAVEDAAVAKEDGTASNIPFHCRIAAAVKNHAEFMLSRDVADNRNIGKHGADAILAQDNVESAEEQVTIMTICNTGSLATSEYGTALGVVRAVHERNRLKSVVALETRPYNQGSRLTAYEIVHDELPGGTLICDCMAAAYMKLQTVHAVVTGADRVAANGDTANKIGTYGLAVAAAAHGVPFYVAAPFTTLDTELASGADIVIEERPAAELLETSRAAENIAVWNPAFDVTPAEYITGIVTEKGVLRRDDVTGRMDVAAFVKQHT